MLDKKLGYLAVNGKYILVHIVQPVKKLICPAVGDIVACLAARVSHHEKSRAYELLPEPAKIAMRNLQIVQQGVFWNLSLP